VVAPSSSPTALKWWFAVEIRRLRKKSGVTREKAAALPRATQSVLRGTASPNYASLG
jgi:hypothetical protein